MTELRVTWAQPEDLIVHEFAQARLDGVDVSEFQQRWVDSGGDLTVSAKGASSTGSKLRGLATALIQEMQANADQAQSGLGPPGTMYRPEPCSPSEMPLSSSELLNRVHGAWLGRAAGCLLGKPVEKIPRQGIRELLESAGRWPLDSYFSQAGVPAAVIERWPWNRRSRPTSLAENIDGMPEDDDLNFPMLNLAMLEDKGTAFETSDVGAAWLSNLPAGRVFTAERIAYRNMLLGYVPPETATVGNPFREWIGAQIRADVYGWTNPGDPSAAAEMAARDATLSHTGNGVYAAMFVAALLADSFTNPSLSSSIEVALRCVPGTSGVAEAVTFGQAAAAEGDWEKAVGSIADHYQGYHWVHSLNNLSLVVAALTHGDGDFGRSICSVVMGGWDTDSNGATVGSVLGVRTGAAGLADRWTAPLKNRVASTLPGFDGVGFDELAARTVALIPAAGPGNG